MKSSYLLISILVTVLSVFAAEQSFAQVRHEVEVTFTASYDLIWSDTGSAAASNVSFWRPTAINGWERVGHHIGPGYGNPTRQTMLVKAKTNGAVTNPVNYNRIWSSAGSKATYPGSVWQPVCSSGYQALGYVTSSSFLKPATTEMVCVHESALVNADPGNPIWNDKGSGATVDFGSWEINPTTGSWSAGLFYASASYSRPTITLWAVNAQQMTPTPIPTPTPNISDGKAVDPKEEKLWAEVEKTNTVKAYQLYLTEYKNGTHADTAKGRIILLSDTSVKPDSTPTNVNPAKTSEDQYWDEVERLEKSSPEIYLNALETYINKYPLDGKYLGKAYLRRDLILKSVKPTPTPTPAPVATPTPLPKVSPDDEFWNKVKDSNRVEDFEVYLKAFPDGDHKADAMLNISRLKPEKKKEPEKEPEPVQPIMCTVNAEANLRDDSKKKILGILKKGRTVVWIEEDGAWDRVGEIKNGIVVSLGWVFNTYLDCP